MCRCPHQSWPADVESVFQAGQRSSRHLRFKRFAFQVSDIYFQLIDINLKRLETLVDEFELLVDCLELRVDGLGKFGEFLGQLQKLARQQQ